jgi:hypothetical protein
MDDLNSTSEVPESGVPKSEPKVKIKRKRKRKRSISTVKLYSLMIVIGIVVGAGAGYAIQEQRTPTPLASFAVAQPKYPQSSLFTGQLPTMLPSTDDDFTIVDGDLTKILLPTPIGATADYDHVWLTLEDAASFCSNQSACFISALSNNVSRIADTSWTLTDGTYVEIRITQYAEGSSGSASEVYNSYGSPAGSTELTLPSGTDALGYAYQDTTNNGANTDYAVTLHGNLLIEFWVEADDATVPDPSIINGLITRQLARL